MEKVPIWCLIRSAARSPAQALAAVGTGRPAGPPRLQRRHEPDDQLARLGREGVVDSRLQHLPSAVERSAKDLDEVVALAAQRKYRALVDKTFPAAQVIEATAHLE
jgi:NADPH:quinone reductase-like Zn-dependent oxidoreductase